MASTTLQAYLGGNPTSTGSMNPSTYNANFASLYPNLSETQGQASANTLSKLRGELSPETLNAIQDSAARFGISAGVPLGGGGSTITGNLGRRMVGQTVEGLQSQGLTDYLNSLKSYSGTLMPTPGDVIGSETSKYATDTSANTAAANLAEQRRSTDINAALQGAQLGIQGAGVGADYLRSYLSFLN